MKWFDVIKDEDTKDDWKKVESTPKTYDTQGGLTRRNRFKRRKGQTMTNEDTGETFTPGSKSSIYPGQRVPTRNYENSCCQELKQSLIKLVNWRINESPRWSGAIKDLGSITRHINSIPCNEINEYMEPPIVDESNFYNFQILGVNIGEFSPEEVGQALGFTKDVYEYLYEEYNRCLDDYYNFGLIKPPSELTDPPKTKFEVKGSDGEIVEIESKEPMREFEGYKFDSGDSQEDFTLGGKFQPDEKTPLERGREALIRDKQVQSGDDNYGLEQMAEPMRISEAQQEKLKRDMPSFPEIKTILVSNDISSEWNNTFFINMRTMWSSRSRNQDYTWDDLTYTLAGKSNKQHLKEKNTGWDSNEFRQAVSQQLGMKTIYDEVSVTKTVAEYFGYDKGKTQNMLRGILQEYLPTLDYRDSLGPGISEWKSKALYLFFSNTDDETTLDAFYDKTLQLVTSFNIKFKKLKSKVDVKAKSKEILDRVRQQKDDYYEGLWRP
jgi:hypothetical protein